MRCVCTLFIRLFIVQGTRPEEAQEIALHQVSQQRSPSDRLRHYPKKAPWPNRCYRLLGLISTVSAAESFRSRWGSVRKVPVCSSQASSAAAPQVGQGTESICFRVSSLVFTAI